MKEVLGRSKLVFLSVMVVCLFCIVANAYTGTAPDFNSTKLTGDWWGERTKLAEKGFTIDIDSVQTYQGVLDGGTNQSWKYGGSMFYRLKFDFQKMGLWEGASLDVIAEHQFGEFVNEDTGNLTAVNNDGLFPLPDYHNINVSQVKFTQFLSPSFAIFLGKINSIEGDDNIFAGGRGKINFLNENFIFNPVSIRTIPYSALGAGAVVFFPDVMTKDHAILSFIVLGADGQPNTSGFEKDFDNGQTFIGAYYQPTRFFNQSGSHTFSGSYGTKDYTLLGQDSRLLLDAMRDFPVTFEKEEDSWSLMYNMHQYLYTEKEDETQGFGIFSRLGTADDKTSTVANFYSVGLGGKGIIEGRDNDTYGIGYFYIQLSNEFNRIIERNFGDSQGLEIFYNIEVKPWLHITPDFQIIEPSNEHVDRTYVAGFRVKMDF
jgi:porin